MIYFAQTPDDTRIDEAIVSETFALGETAKRLTWPKTVTLVNILEVKY